MSYQLLRDPNVNYGYGATPNIPPGGVLQSAGGVSNLVHGGAGSMYSRESERNDIFGASVPRTSKIYGNMYATGPSYMENISISDHSSMMKAYDYPYAWDHNPGPHRWTPSLGDGSGYVGETSYDREHNYQTNEEGDRENFTYLNEEGQGVTPLEQPHKISSTFMFFLIITLFIMVALWYKTFDLVVAKFLYGKESLTWVNYGTLAIIMTLFIIFILYFSGNTIHNIV